MGPAFAHHFSSDGQVVRPASSSQQCGSSSGGLGSTFTSSVPIPGAVNAPGSKPGAYIYYRLSTYSCNEVVVPAERRGWDGDNPALGLRYTKRFDDHSTTYLVNWVRDSYGTSSVMLAGGRMWPLLDAVSVKVDAGVVGGLWYRSVLNRAEDGLVRRVVPFALPSVSMTETHTGIGVDLGFAPRLSINGYMVNRTPTLMVQLNYLVKSTKVGDTKVGLQGSAGGVQASLATTF